jgi:hypothetical protein
MARIVLRVKESVFFSFFSLEKNQKNIFAHLKEQC